MKYDELKCHDCGKHLGSIIDTGPRGMSFCDKHSDVDTRPQTEQAEASSLSDLLCCPFCGEELRMFKTFGSNYAVAHKCESGLRIEIGRRKKKEIIAILSKRAI